MWLDEDMHAVVSKCCKYARILVPKVIKDCLAVVHVSTHDIQAETHLQVQKGGSVHKESGTVVERKNALIHHHILHTQTFISTQTKNTEQTMPFGIDPRKAQEVYWAFL